MNPNFQNAVNAVLDQSNGRFGEYEAKFGRVWKAGKVIAYVDDKMVLPSEFTSPDEDKAIQDVNSEMKSNAVKPGKEAFTSPGDETPVSTLPDDKRVTEPKGPEGEGQEAEDDGENLPGAGPGERPTSITKNPKTAKKQKAPPAVNLPAGDTRPMPDLPVLTIKENIALFLDESPIDTTLVEAIKVNDIVRLTTRYLAKAADNNRSKMFEPGVEFLVKSGLPGGMIVCTSQTGDWIIRGDFLSKVIRRDVAPVAQTIESVNEGRIDKHMRDIPLTFRISINQKEDQEHMETLHGKDHFYEAVEFTVILHSKNDDHLENREIFDYLVWHAAKVPVEEVIMKHISSQLESVCPYANIDSADLERIVRELFVKMDAVYRYLPKEPKYSGEESARGARIAGKLREAAEISELG